MHKIGQSFKWISLILPLLVVLLLQVLPRVMSHSDLLEYTRTLDDHAAWVRKAMSTKSMHALHVRYDRYKVKTLVSDPCCNRSRARTIIVWRSAPVTAKIRVIVVAWADFDGVVRRVLVAYSGERIPTQAHEVGVNIHKWLGVHYHQCELSGFVRYQAELLDIMQWAQGEDLAWGELMPTQTPYWFLIENQIVGVAGKPFGLPFLYWEADAHSRIIHTGAYGS